MKTKAKGKEGGPGWDGVREQRKGLSEEEAAVGSVGTGSVPVTVRKSHGEGL